LEKKHKGSFLTEKSWRENKILDIIHSDLCTVDILTYSGSRYFIAFIDHFSRKTCVYFLKQKSKA